MRSDRQRLEDVIPAHERHHVPHLGRGSIDDELVFDAVRVRLIPDRDRRGHQGHRRRATILLDLESEDRAVVLDHAPDEAAVAIADLYVATGTRDRYEIAARRLGSQSWRSIESMAESQLKARDRPGAVAVFLAADQPGRHRDCLRGKCLAMTGVDLAGEEQGAP